MVVSSQFRLLSLTGQEQHHFGRIRTHAAIRKLSGQEFERFVGYLYQQDGYTVLDGPPGPDGGVDLVLQRPGYKQIVQCKRYNSRAVSEQVVRDLLGTAFHQGADGAVLVTSGAVTQPARNFAATTPNAIPIDIIDGPTLASWAHRVNPTPATLPHSARPAQRAFFAHLWSQLAPGDKRFAGLVGFLLVVILFLLFGNWLLSLALPVSANVTNPGMGQGTEDSVAPEQRPNAQQQTPDAAQGVPATPLPTLTPTSTPPPPDPRALISPYRRPPIDINGDLSEWDGFPSAESMYRVYTGTLDAAHLDTMSATWRAGWDETYLYVGVEVFDDVHVQNRAGRNLFLGDCVEFQLDADPLDDGMVVNGDDYIVLLSPGDFGDVMPSAYLMQGGGDGAFSADTPLTIAVAARPTVNGYDLEAAINWSLLGVTPQPGLILGIALNSSDNDTVGAALQEALYSHVPDREYLIPATWGTVILTD